MFRVNKTVLVRVLLPARVVALVGDVALASPRLKLPQVQPRLVVLTKTEQKSCQSIWLAVFTPFTFPTPSLDHVSQTLLLTQSTDVQGQRSCLTSTSPPGSLMVTQPQVGGTFNSIHVFHVLTINVHTTHL